jgi:cystine transport system substrate-binding protein
MKNVYAVKVATLCASLIFSASALAQLPAKLNAATSGNLPPVSFTNEKNELDGYDIRVARFIEKQIGIPIELNRLDFKGILPGLQTGRFDIVFSNVNITPERKSVFDYSIPYSRSAVVMVVRQGVIDIKSVKDLKGKRVGGIAGANDGEMPARQIEKEVGKFRDFKGYSGYTEMFTDMAAGRLDAIIAPDTAASNVIRERPGLAAIVGQPYQVRFVGAPMRKGASVELKAKVDDAIRLAKKEGLLDQWAKEYFGIDNFSSQLVEEVR